MKKLPSRTSAFADWYNTLVLESELAEHGPVRGTMVIRPYGYALWELLQQSLDRRIKETGHENAYFPLLIPENFLKREREHIKGFSPELAVVTYGGGKKLEEPLVVRPTSETVIYDTLAKWVSSYRDLPIMLNQWVNVVRWELRTRLFLRTTEFLWQEGHTAHETEAEAEAEARTMLSVYQRFVEDVLAIPVVFGEKSEAERFAGAQRTYAIEALMPDGKSLQMGTTHNLGQNFAKSFHIQFLDRKGKRQYVWQTSWGVSTRLIGAIIMAHGDDQGLRLPPVVAPYQVVVVPILKDRGNTQVLEGAQAIRDQLHRAGLRVLLDDRDDETPGFKFNKWEQRGVPIRLEFGAREQQNRRLTYVRRDTKQRFSLAWNSTAPKKLLEICQEIHDQLFQQAKDRTSQQTFHANTLQEFHQLIEKGWVYAPWCGKARCEAQVKNTTKATIRVLPFQQKKQQKPCLVCGQPALFEALFARTY